LVFLFCLYNSFGIFSSLQFLQFGICVQFLQKKIIFEWYFVFHFCKIWYFDFSSASAIWYLCFVSAIVLVFLLLFNFCKKKKNRVIFCLLLLQNLVFWLSFNFCNLVFLFCLCNCFGISFSLQFLQFSICVQFLQKKKLEWYFVFRLCKIWYFDFPSASAIWYFCSVSAIILVFRLLFNFCNLVFEFSFCKIFWSDILSSAFAKSGISTFLQLLSWHLLPKKLFGYVSYLLIREFSFLILLLCIVTIRVLFRLLTIQLFYSDCSQLGFSRAN